MNEKDIVMIIGFRSVPKDFLGKYGKVVATYEEKVLVEFTAAMGDFGSFTHTAYRSDLKRIGRVTVEP